MKFDKTIEIAFGASAATKVWKNKKIKWSNLVSKLSEGFKTNETFKEYSEANKVDKAKIKDVGGYVGGYLQKGKRSPSSVIYRTLLTLDIDFGYPSLWEDFTMQFSFATVLHSTHSHHPDSPRYRLIIPVDRDMSPDEYVAVSRKIAGYIGIETFDNTTFETNRLMFWPSTSIDVDYYFKFQDGEFLDVDEVLSYYEDWTDSSQWPVSEADLKNVRSGVEKQEDPELKRGMVGAFCKAHDVHSAIKNFLGDLYESCSSDRYTYKNGTAQAGAIVYDDKFIFSHHGTDPISGKLCNSFDLVRLHKFGHLDSPSNKDTSNTSFKAMQEFAMSDPKVKKIIAEDKLEGASYDFAEDLELDEDEDDRAWMEDLELNSKKEYVSSANNLNLIFKHDPRLKNKFKQNHFDSKKYVFSGVPWRKVKNFEPVKNIDFSGVRNYLESIYGISGLVKVEDALAVSIEKNGFNPVLSYLSELNWDGVKRVDNLLIEYFGAEDNQYTREAIRKPLVAAVSRVFNPGCKFDLVLTLVGEEGTKKSTFLNKIGKSWYSDTFMTVHGKEALEQIQGCWIIEMAELSGLRKAEVESIKHFITKQEDTFRPAYGRTSETYKRQCVFFGTTNKKDFLTGSTGNRRFIPVDVVKRRVKKDVFVDLDKEVDQVWAEAVHLYRNKETLYMSEEASAIARSSQISHSETDERSGPIEEYLNTKLPKDWDKRDLFDRRNFLSDSLSSRGEEVRNNVCIAEIWCECLGREKHEMDRYKTRQINDIMKAFEEWEHVNSTKNFGFYGKQKYYTRKKD